MLDHFNNNDISYDSLANELKVDFNDDHCIVVNNKRGIRR